MKFTTEVKNLKAYELLDDKKNNGGVYDWQGYKKRSLYLSESYKRLGYDAKYRQVKLCASSLTFKSFEDGSKKLHGGMFCKKPLCPMCSARRSRKIFGQVSKIMRGIEQGEENIRFLFLTLTMKNVSGSELPAALDKLFYGLHQLVHYVSFKRLSLGWFRALEVTHNWKTDEYHPHMHMIIAVKSSYFDRKENYLTHEEWKRLWQKAMNLEYEPYVRIQRVKKKRSEGTNEEISYVGAVAEVAKYSTKSSDFMVDYKDKKEFEKKNRIKVTSKKQAEDMTDRAVAVLDGALHRRRLIAFGGIFKELHKKLNLDDPENGELENTNCDTEIHEDVKYVIEVYRWSIGFGNYMLVETNEPDYHRKE